MKPIAFRVWRVISRPFQLFLCLCCMVAAIVGVIWVSTPQPDEEFVRRSEEIRRRFDQIQLGMRLHEVNAVLGKEPSIVIIDREWIWQFRETGGTVKVVIAFDNNGFATDQRIIVEHHPGVSRTD